MRRQPGGLLVGAVALEADPLTAADVRMLNDASLRCDRLVVLLHSDDWLSSTEKVKRRQDPSYPFEERRQVLLALRSVDAVLPVVDWPSGSVVRGLWDLWHNEAELAGHRLVLFVRNDFKDAHVDETAYCRERGILIVYGVGADLCRE